MSAVTNPSTGRPASASIVMLPAAIRVSPNRWTPADKALYLYDELGRRAFAVNRHFNDTLAPFWFGVETRYDSAGRAWDRDLRMVVNDFGVLVEVQR